MASHTPQPFTIAFMSPLNNQEEMNKEQEEMNKEQE